MNKNLNIRERWFEHNGISSCCIDDVLWREYKRMIVPVGPAEFNYSLTHEQLQILFQKFPSAIACRYTTYEENFYGNCDFYAVVCRKQIHLESLESKRRSEINRGLRNCKVSIVNPLDICDEAYFIYRKSVEGYGHKPLSASAFKKEFVSVLGFEDFVNFWGVFSEDKLIAYAKVYLYESNEASVSLLKIDDDFLNYYPSYALFYHLLQYYIGERGFKLVNDGHRNLLHETNIQEFLIKKFGFEMLQLRVHLQYKKPWGLVIRVLNPFAPIIKLVYPPAEALIKLHRIFRKQKSIAERKH